MEINLGPSRMDQTARTAASKGAVARDVRRERWCRQERRPGRDGDCGGVPVEIGFADRGDRTPEIVGELGVPAGDRGVDQGQVQQGETRASLTSESWRWTATCSAIAFQCPGGVSVPVPSDQRGRSGSDRRCGSCCSRSRETQLR